MFVKLEVISILLCYCTPIECFQTGSKSELVKRGGGKIITMFSTCGITRQLVCGAIPREIINTLLMHGRSYEHVYQFCVTLYEHCVCFVLRKLLPCCTVATRSVLHPARSSEVMCKHSIELFTFQIDLRQTNTQWSIRVIIRKVNYTIVLSSECMKVATDILGKI